MKRFLLFVLLVFGISGAVQAQTYKWVKGGGTGQFLSSYILLEAAYSMCADQNGNVYTLSEVGGSWSYPITADTFYRPAAYGGSQNVLFTSHNCNGQMRFAKLISGSEVFPHGVVADNAGHIYLAFDGRHDAVSSQNLRIGYDTTISGDIYRRQTLIQYDTTGHINWLRFVGNNTLSTYTGTGGTFSYLALDGMDNPHFIVATGYGVNLTTSLVSHYGYYDLNYDVSGSLLSVNKLQLDSSLIVSGLTIDKQSNKMYAFGARNNSMFPDSSWYPFMAALDVSRNRIWIDTTANPVFPTLVEGFASVIADGVGHLYASLGGSKSVAFRGDTAINQISATGEISVIMKMDTAGNPLWMRTYSSTLSVNTLFGLTLMGNHKIAACGVMAGIVGSGSDAITSYSGEGQNSWFTIVDTAGYVHAIQQIHGTGFYDRANRVVANSIGSLYIGGQAETNVWAGSLSPYTCLGGDSDYFILKYGVDCSCPSMPFANYTYSGTDLIRSFTYTGTTSGVDSVRWSFGDGSTSTTTSPTHPYTAAGTYTVCVRIYSACGNDMHCKEVTVTCAVAPISSFIDTGVLVHGFTYTGTIAGYDSVVWDFGDGSFDTGLHVIHTYAVADTYHVCAKVYTNCGTHTWCKDVIIVDMGVVSVTPLADIKVFPNPATNELYITGIGTKTEYRLLNVVGATMQAGMLHVGFNALQTQQLPQGIYMLEIMTFDGQKKVVRVVKQ